MEVRGERREERGRGRIAHKSPYHAQMKAIVGKKN